MKENPQTKEATVQRAPAVFPSLREGSAANPSVKRHNDEKASPGTPVSVHPPLSPQEGFATSVQVCLPPHPPPSERNLAWAPSSLTIYVLELD